MKQLIAVLLICIATVAFADLRDDLSQQSQILRQEETRLEQLNKAIIQQTAIVNQRRGIVTYIQFQLEQEKKAEEVYRGEKK